jgi:hypothetical protein
MIVLNEAHLIRSRVPAFRGVTPEVQMLAGRWGSAVIAGTRITRRSLFGWHSPVKLTVGCPCHRHTRPRLLPSPSGSVLGPRLRADAHDSTSVPSTPSWPLLLGPAAIAAPPIPPKEPGWTSKSPATQGGRRESAPAGRGPTVEASQTTGGLGCVGLRCAVAWSERQAGRVAADHPFRACGGSRPDRASVLQGCVAPV